MTQQPQASSLSAFGWEGIVDLALREDIGTGDVTTIATVPEHAQASGTILAKGDGIISGIDVAAYVFARIDPDVTFTPRCANGDRVDSGDVLAELAGRAWSILTAERTALNFLQRLSGVATVTARYVAGTEGTSARIVDTRKTTPGMRLLEKRAVQHGGGENHRFGLSDGVLIKDNHLGAIGGRDPVARAIKSARATAPHTLKIEVEVSDQGEYVQALVAGADIILLDNMSTEAMAAAVQHRNKLDAPALLEASGGVTLERIPAIAATGVDLISVGALTHSARALDVSLDIALEVQSQ